LIQLSLTTALLSLRVLEQAVGPNGRGPWRRVGHLVEKPAAYSELTVKENLEIARRLQQIADRRATSSVIERLMDGATLLKCSEFGDAIIKHMDD